MAKQKIIRRTFQAVSETKAEEGSRTLIARISTSSPDRSNDIVVPQGMVADNFRRNPVVQLFHNYNDLPIAKAPELQVTNDSVLAKVDFPEQGTYEKADTVYSLYKQGIMNAWSIGFIPLEWEDLPNGGRKFTKWELYEFSAVPIPANAEALTVMRSAGIDDIEVEDIDKHLEEVVEVKDKKDGKAQAKETKTEPAEKKEETAVEQKDLAEVVSLSYVMGDLSWLIWAFEDNKVSETSTEKMKQALSLLMEVVKEQAELGKKEFSKTGEIKEIVEQKMQEAEELSAKLVQVTKEGRVISGANRKLLNDTVGKLDEAKSSLNTLLEASDKEEEKPEEKTTDSKTVLILRNTLRDVDKKIGIVLRDTKEKGN